MKNADMPAMPATVIEEVPVEGLYLAPGVQATSPCEVDYTGLTKREVFAMHAMQAQITADDEVKPENVAKYAVEYADALLKELDK